MADWGTASMFDQKLNELLEDAIDLREPHINFKGGRKTRRIIFHSGPPNSGKTHEAILDFARARSGIYCCPLRLLAGEVAQKTKAMGVDCDMITGEEVILARYPSKSFHKACTVQLADLDNFYNVGIIDEIQMLADPQNGWAFTRAFLGINTRTLHVCGDYSAYKLIRTLARRCGEEVELKRHVRPNRVNVLTVPLGQVSNVQEGDCIVCFSRAKIRSVAKTVERFGKKPAIVYGSLPPDTKKAQIENFNSVTGDKKVLIATDAIGMGLNAEIHRVIFYEFQKTSRDRSGVAERRLLTPLEFRQIGGRAARQFSRYGEGDNMALFAADVPTLKKLSETDPPNLETAGIRPPVDCIVLFSQVMETLQPNMPFEVLLDCYLERVQIDTSLYFLCTMEDIKEMAKELKDINLKVEDKYSFCCAPIQLTSEMQKNMLINMAKNFRDNKVMNVQWMKDQLGWKTIERSEIIEVSQMAMWEDLYSTLSLYNWMSHKFKYLFPDEDEINRLKEWVASKLNTALNRINSLIDVTSARNSRQSSARQRNRYPDDPMNNLVSELRNLRF